MVLLFVREQWKFLQISSINYAYDNGLSWHSLMAYIMWITLKLLIFGLYHYENTRNVSATQPCRYHMMQALVITERMKELPFDRSYRFAE